MHLPRIVGVLTVGGALLAAQVPVSASAPSTLIIGVDHQDPANQRPDQGRLFEYTDFFSRAVKVHQGDTLDFNFQGFHDIAVARSEQFAKSQQPLATADLSDPPSVSTGKAKISVNPVVFAFGSGCGWTAPLGEPACEYKGGNDLKISGPPPGPPGPPPLGDWQVTINAGPGTYTYFCYIHPGMKGKVTVVPADEPVTSQAQNDAVSQQQFLKEKAQAERAEQAADVVRFTGDEPGDRTYFVTVGISAANNHVAIDEMFPNGVKDPSKQLNLVAGDRVAYSWGDRHNAHSVTFPPDAVAPFGFDCAAGFVTPPPGPPGPPPCTEAAEPPELITDPGNAPSGTELTAPATVVDAGVRLGKDFELPTTTHWTITTGDGTSPGTYHFNCNIHDFMLGTLNVAAASDGEGDRAHA